MQPYIAPRWLPGAHLQTIWPVFLRGRMPTTAFRRERISTPDGDFLDLDWISDTAGAPLLVLFHGLEGSSASHYAKALMQAAAQRRWNGVVVHFRGCSGEPNLLPRAYHSGDSAEVGWILQHLRSRKRDNPVFAVGVSLGGNAMLKWLGEQGARAETTVDAAAAVSVPYDLAAADRCLSRWPAILYARHFLQTLIPASLAKARRFPETHGFHAPERIRSARTLREFDDAVTAPLHGFENADAYYSHSSAAQYLRGITVPTLLIHARNDPFLPPEAIPLQKELPANVQLEISTDGGHAGFVNGAFPGRLDWLPERILTEFARHVQHTRGNRVA